MAETNLNSNTEPQVQAGQNAVIQPQAGASETQAAVGPLGQANQAAAQAQQAVGQVGEQAKQTVAQAQQTAQQVQQQAQQLASTATQTANQAQTLVKDLLMPKANQPKVGVDEKLFGLISYIPLVSFVSLIIKGDSKFVLLHGRQGLILTILAFFNLFLALFPFIGGGLFGIVGFAIFVVAVYSAYQALIGNWWKIPVLGDIAEMIPVSMFVQATKEALTGQISDQNIQPQEPVSVAPEGASAIAPAQTPESQAAQPAGQLPPQTSDQPPAIKA